MLVPAGGQRGESQRTRSPTRAWTFPSKVSISKNDCYFSNNQRFNSKVSASSRSQSERPWDTATEGKAEEQRHLLQLSLTPQHPQLLCRSRRPAGRPARGQLPWRGLKAVAQGRCRQQGRAGSTRGVGTALPATGSTFPRDGDRHPPATAPDLPAATPPPRAAPR